MMKARNLIVVAVVLLACAQLFAQQITGSIRGTVVDPSGAMVQAATVTARQVETGSDAHRGHRSQGDYLLLELPDWALQLEVAAKGFQKYLQQGISLNVNETATVRVHLKVGAETQQVQVQRGRRTGADHGQQSGRSRRWSARFLTCRWMAATSRSWDCFSPASCP